MKLKCIIGLVFTCFLLPVSAKEYQLPSSLTIKCQEKLYPIGWSKTGNFAYLLFYDVGGLCGVCPTYKLVVQSMVTDKVLFSKIFEAMTEDNKAQSAADFWDKNYTLISSTLQKYAIMPQHDIVLRKDSFLYRNKHYAASVSATPGTYEFHPHEAPVSQQREMISSATIFMRSPELGQKKIYSYTRNNYDTITGYTIAGYIVSPFEKRSLVVVVVHSIGAEGESDTSFQFIGAHLTSGYIKSSGLAFNDTSVFGIDKPGKFVNVYWSKPNKKNKEIPQALYFEYKNFASYVVFEFSTSNKVYYAVKDIQLRGTTLSVTLVKNNKRMVFTEVASGGSARLKVRGFINVVYLEGAM